MCTIHEDRETCNVWSAVFDLYASSAPEHQKSSSKKWSEDPRAYSEDAFFRGGFRLYLEVHLLKTNENLTQDLKCGLLSEETLP